MIVLASGSATRARLLTAAGVAFAVDPPALDEAAVKSAARSQGLAAADCAAMLAEAKALAIWPAHPRRIVLGSDQMLECGGDWFDKPADAAAARAQLLALRGREHHLPTAAALVRDGRVLWRQVDSPRLRMREFSDGFLDAYLAQAGGALGSVGAYHLEGLGAQLMELVQGDHFAVQGLPLLPLLRALRDLGELPT